MVQRPLQIVCRVLARARRRGARTLAEAGAAACFATSLRGVLLVAVSSGCEVASLDSPRAQLRRNSHTRERSLRPGRLGGSRRDDPTPQDAARLRAGGRLVY